MVLLMPRCPDVSVSCSCRKATLLSNLGTISCVIVRSPAGDSHRRWRTPCLGTRLFHCAQYSLVVGLYLATYEVAVLRNSFSTSGLVWYQDPAVGACWVLHIALYWSVWGWHCWSWHSYLAAEEEEVKYCYNLSPAPPSDLAFQAAHNACIGQEGMAT